MQECIYLEKCPIFQTFKKQTNKKNIINEYCQGSYKNCERWNLKNKEKEVPIILMPDGSFIQ